jgi:hypothetical protein
MTASVVRAAPLDRHDLFRLLRAGVFTGISDGVFACVLAPTVLHITVARLWQGVASVLIGPGAFEGGTQTALIGVLMHFGVAFSWSTVLFVLVERSAWLRGVLRSRFGVLKVASVYGPCIWVAMSLVVIPLLLHRAPAITLRWLIQLVGHAPFVGLPMTAAIAGGGRLQR